MLQPSAASARQSPAVMVPSSNAAAEGTAAGGGPSFCPRQGRPCSALRLLRKAAGTALSSVSAMPIGPPLGRQAARCWATRCPRRLCPQPCSARWLWRRRRCATQAAGSGTLACALRSCATVGSWRGAPPRTARAGARRARLVQILLRYFARPAPTSGSSCGPAVKGHRTVDRSWGISLPTVSVWSLSSGHRVPGRPPQ